jgi:hypothetical protein
MNKDLIMAILDETPKGANIIIEWERDAKTKKNSPEIRKAVRMIGRVGIEYDNIGKVQEKRETGELPKENAGLPDWQEWEVYPYLLRHKTKGTNYVRLYKGTSEKVMPKVTWLLNGEPVAKEDISDYLYASELKTSEGDCFQCKIEDITKLNLENEKVEVLSNKITQEKNAQIQEELENEELYNEILS